MLANSGNARKTCFQSRDFTSTVLSCCSKATTGGAWDFATARDWKSCGSAGLALGERPYDFYTLETAEDLSALGALLTRHRDANGRHPCVEMNFVVANLDFAKMRDEEWKQVHLVPLWDGLPAGWTRPGLMDAYREGIANGVFHPALHGITHFCRTAVERSAKREDDRGKLLRKLWQAGTPYIHWRMPWIGYEYWDPEKPEEERFLVQMSSGN